MMGTGANNIKRNSLGIKEKVAFIFSQQEVRLFVPIITTMAETMIFEIVARGNPLQYTNRSLSQGASIVVVIQA